jgi:hypothetical protein
VILGIQIGPREAAPKTELSFNFPSAYLFELQADYFEQRVEEIEFSDIKKIPSSHIGGKWRVQPAQLVGGRFKIDITANNGESKVKTNFSFLNVNLCAILFVVPFFGALLMMLIPQTLNSNILNSSFFQAGALMAGTTGLIERWRRKRNAIRRRKELFK